MTNYKDFLIEYVVNKVCNILPRGKDQKVIVHKKRLKTGTQALDSWLK